MNFILIFENSGISKLLRCFAFEQPSRQRDCFFQSWAKKERLSKKKENQIRNEYITKQSKAKQNKEQSREKNVEISRSEGGCFTFE